MNVIFATTERAEAERRMRASNRCLSDDTVSRVGALVDAGAIRVGDNRMHTPGSIFQERVLTEAERAELAAIEAQAVVETRAARSAGAS